MTLAACTRTEYSGYYHVYLRPDSSHVNQADENEFQQVSWTARSYSSANSGTGGVRLKRMIELHVAVVMF